MPTLVPGQLVEKYRVVRLIASGGFGAVYEVLREDIRQRGALKVLTLNAEPAMVQRFINEARAAGAIRHPNIPQVYDLGMFPDGVPWLVMEYLEGVSLEAHLVAHRRLTLPDVLEIFEDAAGAVAAAHAVKDPGPIIHRDLKPSNVMLLPSPKRGCGFRAMVLDFGIAKLAGDNLTKSGTILGTPIYMAPEQAVDASSVDGQADVHSLGLMLFQCLAGRLPFEWEPKRGTFALLLAKESPPAPIHRYCPTLPQDVQTIVMRTLARDKSQRPTMAELEAFFGEAQQRYPRPNRKSTANPVVSVGGLGPGTQLQDDAELDPTSDVSAGDVPVVASAPSLSASLLQSDSQTPPPATTPSAQMIRGEISPDPPIPIPKSISDVPSMPVSAPALRSSPEDRTVKPAPTQGVPVKLASPIAPTAPAVPVIDNGAIVGGASRTVVVLLAGVAVLLSVALTGAVWSWYRPDTPVRPTAALDTNGQFAASPQPTQPATLPPTKSQEPATQSPALLPPPTTDKPVMVAPQVKRDDAANKTTPRSRECDPVPPTDSCTMTPSMDVRQRALLISALAKSGARWCLSDSVTIVGLPGDPTLASPPRSFPEEAQRPALLTLRGMLRGHVFPSRVKIQCRPR